MFELPETVVLTRQMNEHLRGKVIKNTSLGNSPHKFAFYNCSEKDFKSLVIGKTVGAARALGRWMFIDIGDKHRLVLGETGGSLILNPAGAKLPPKYHFLLLFTDGSALTQKIQMWGAMELYENGKELQRQYIKDMAPVPLDPTFSPEYFADLVAKLRSAGKQSVKALLTQNQSIPGLGNSCAQDIMFLSGLNPKRELSTLCDKEIQNLYDSIMKVLNGIIAQGGRNDETDLFGNPGGYQRIMNAAAAGKPCHICGEIVQKMQYLGGACYWCPGCQK